MLPLLVACYNSVVFALKEAEKALKYYKGYKGKTLEECHAFSAEFQRLSGVIEQQKTQEKLKFYDLCECFS